METPDEFRYIPVFEDMGGVGFKRKRAEELTSKEREYLAAISEHEKAIQYHRQQIQELAHHHLGNPHDPTRQ